MVTETIDEQIAPILQLNLQKRIYVYQLIWQSILKDMQIEDSILTDEQKNEIDRRLERIDRGDAKLFSWESVKEEIKMQL